MTNVLDRWPGQIVAGAPSILALSNEVAKWSVFLTVYHDGYLVMGTLQGKAIPLQGWTVPEVYRRLSLPDFKTIGT